MFIVDSVQKHKSTPKDGESQDGDPGPAVGLAQSGQQSHDAGETGAGEQLVGLPSHHHHLGALGVAPEGTHGHLVAHGCIVDHEKPGGHTVETIAPALAQTTERTQTTPH